MNRIVIPVVLGRLMTERCIKSALAQDVGDVHVVVIGNGCTDGTIEYIRGKFWGNPHLVVIAHSMRSLNWVWNRALEHAWNNDAEHVMIVNNDIEMRTDTYRLLRDDGGLFVTGVSVDDRAACQKSDPSLKSPHPCFSCFLMRRECWQRVGRFEEDYWAYASDASYHVRMHRAGVKAYALAVPFYHETSSTIRLASNELRDMLQLRADADRALFKKQWGCDIGSEQYNSLFNGAR